MRQFLFQIGKCLSLLVGTLSIKSRSRIRREGKNEIDW